MGGLVALYFELTAPGIGVGGLITSLCAALFFWSRMSGGTSGWLEVLLFMAGIIFIIMEVFVIPGFGIAGLGGVLLLISSVILASQDFVIPQTVWEWNQLMVSLITVACSGLIFIVAAFFITRSLGSLPLFNRLVLTPDGPVVAINAGDGKDATSTAQPKISVGDWGKASSLLRPSGRAIFNGRSYDVVSDGSFVDPETPVKVVRIQGNMITVGGSDGMMEAWRLDHLNNVGHVITETAARMPRAIAVAAAAKKGPKKSTPQTPIRYDELSFGDLEARTNRLARGFINSGVEKGDRIALMVPPGIDFVAVVFALFKCGVVVILIDPGMGRKNMLHCLASADPVGMVGIPLGPYRQTSKAKIVAIVQEELRCREFFRYPKGVNV